MKLPGSELPPALLADATWYGTLAAARDLGSRGVPVVLACDSLVAPARWSRHVARVVACPPTRDATRFLAWLRQFGSRHPGHVLYPTSDDLAFLVAAHREELSRHYQLFTPEVEGLLDLLDKGRLGAAAAAAGLETPRTWLPGDEAEVEAVSREAAFPVFVKPRLQVLAQVAGKGQRVDRPEALAARWREWRDRARYHPALRERAPDAALPLVQEHFCTRERIYTVDGFADRDGVVLAMRGCNKILQLPRRTGPGVAFEAAPVEPAIAEGLGRLCRAVRFRGVFDAEFARDGERKLLIDFNPRFYNHMAFEVDRGMPLPWLAYLGALGDTGALGTAAAVATAPRLSARAYVHGLPTSLLLAVQAINGAMSQPARKALRDWIADRAGSITDPAVAPGDRLPALAEVVLSLVNFLRHPRAYLRDLAAGGDSPPRPAPAAAPGPVHSPVSRPAEVG